METMEGLDWCDLYVPPGLFRPDEPATSEVLTFLKKVKVRATDRFVVADHFRFGQIKGVPIGSVNDFFIERFGRLIDEPQPPITLACHELAQLKTKTSIINQSIGRGINPKCSQIWSLLEHQGDGEFGPLQTYLRANLFLALDCEDIPQIVRLFLNPSCGRWDVGAFPTDFVGYEWRMGGRVFK